MTAAPDEQEPGDYARPDLIDDVDDLIGACGPDAVFAALRLAELIHRDGFAAVATTVADCLAGCEGWTTVHEPGPAEPEQQPVPLNATEQAVWAAWKTLDQDDPSPVKRIARDLGMAPADVAFIVYPAEQLGPWHDSQEPDLPERPPGE